MDQSLKKILHKIWDKSQVYDEKLIRKFLTGFKELDSIDLRNEFRNWLGGYDAVFEKVEEFLSKPKHVRVGGYDFDYKPINWDINVSNNHDMWVELDSSVVDANGKVTLDGYDGNTYDIGEVMDGEEFSGEDNIAWEVDDEINNIIKDQLKDLLMKNFGVDLIYYHNLVYDDQAFDKSLRENILTELAEKYYDEDITKSFELVINKLLKKKYEWFDRIIINKLSYSKDSNHLGIVAELFADEDWVGNQWMEHHYSTPIPSGTEDDPISLGDIISGELSKQLQGHFKNVFSIITSEKKPKYMSWSWIDVIPVEMDNKKLQESISRIREVMGIITETKEEEKVLRITSLKIFNNDWFQLQEFLEKKGNPPYTIGGDLFLYGTPIKSLGKLTSVGGTLYLTKTPIKSLGNLQSVGGSLYLRYTPISEKYSEEEIRQMVNVDGEIYL